MNTATPKPALSKDACAGVKDVALEGTDSAEVKSGQLYRLWLTLTTCAEIGPSSTLVPYPNSMIAARRARYLCSTARWCGKRSWRDWRSAAAWSLARGSTGSSTSMRICPRATRLASTMCRSQNTVRGECGRLGAGREGPHGGQESRGDHLLGQRALARALAYEPFSDVLCLQWCHGVWQVWPRVIDYEEPGSRLAASLEVLASA